MQILPRSLEIRRRRKEKVSTCHISWTRRHGGRVKDQTAYKKTAADNTWKYKHHMKKINLKCLIWMDARNPLAILLFLGHCFLFLFFFLNSSGIPALFSSSSSSGFISCGYLSLEVSAGFALLRIFRRREEEEGGRRGTLPCWYLESGPKQIFFLWPSFPHLFLWRIPLHIFLKKYRYRK